MNNQEEKYFALLRKMQESGGISAQNTDAEEQLVALAYEKLQHALLSSAHPPMSALIAFVLGEADETSKSAMSAHLLECPECREAFEELDAERIELDSFLENYSFPFDAQDGK